MRRSGCCVLAILAGLSGAPALADEFVPFVGCKTQGNGLSEEIPSGDPQSLHANRFLAEKLAWYEDAGETGLFAPRDWSCSAGYGSGGHHLEIRKTDSPDQRVGVYTADSEFSGRYVVAQFLSQFFPKGHEAFIASVAADWKDVQRPGSPTDQIRYRDAASLDFVTPAGTIGIGTLSKSPSPYRIIGRVCVSEAHGVPEVSVLSVALPDDRQGLARAIVKAWEGCES